MYLLPITACIVVGVPKFHTAQIYEMVTQVFRIDALNVPMNLLTAADNLSVVIAVPLNLIAMVLTLTIAVLLVTMSRNTV